MNKIIVILPGVGYTADRPLLYYTRKIAASHGYTAVIADYGDIERNVLSDPRADFLRMASEVTPRTIEQIRSHITEDNCLFAGKSIGTILAVRAMDALHIRSTSLVLFTPLEEALQELQQNEHTSYHAVAFHGTNDRWVNTERLTQLCEQSRIPLHITQGANHSLETGNVAQDIACLQRAMQETDAFISSIKAT